MEKWLNLDSELFIYLFIFQVGQPEQLSATQDTKSVSSSWAILCHRAGEVAKQRQGFPIPQPPLKWLTLYWGALGHNSRRRERPKTLVLLMRGLGNWTCIWSIVPHHELTVSFFYAVGTLHSYIFSGCLGDSIKAQTPVLLNWLLNWASCMLYF